MSILGIHHITALASDPQRNVDFYVGFLGLRLVKQTVNFDAPDVYHLYYGDQAGRPGTILTFFPFLDAARGKRGVGEITAVAFSIPSRSLDFWVDRLAGNAVQFDGPFRRFNDDVVSFEDPDGMAVELIADPSADTMPGWKGSSVDSMHAIRKLHGATFTQRDLEPPARFLADLMGFGIGEVEGNRHRFFVGMGDCTAKIDIITDSTSSRGRQSAGSVHHIAWRVTDDEQQVKWREKLVRSGYSVTPVLDRNYFHSIYFREPGGILCEIATDPPGFVIDEPVDALGTHLKLPQWLEPKRASIEESLTPLKIPLQQRR